MRTIFGNPGSTEQPKPKNFPFDFKYIIGLQEASIVAMVDGFSQARCSQLAHVRQDWERNEQYHDRIPKQDATNLDCRSVG